MTRISKIALLAFTLVALPVVCVTLHANASQPHYLRALSELRTARALLQGIGGASLPDEEEIAAARAIDDAIANIHGASIDDGKDPDNRPSIDAHLSRKERLQKALDQLYQAEQNCAKEDAPVFSGLKAQVIQQIEQSRQRISALNNMVDLSGYRCTPDLPCVAGPARSN
jgi:hypothetical protein